MKRYPAKLLLFGEYGLMFGAKALAIPFPTYSGCFATPNTASQSEYQKNSNAELRRFVSWYEQEQIALQMNFPLDIGRLSVDLEVGLYFESDVPLQYGVGSSGALCAGLYDCYSRFSGLDDFNPELEGDQILQLKADFVLLESYFHGRSSGLDPLVAFLNRPVRVSDGKINLPALSLNTQPWAVHLIDTGMTSATSPLVKLFLEKMAKADFGANFRDNYLPVNDGVVDAFMRQDADSFFENLKRLHDFQLINFSEMFPEPCLPLIEELARLGIFVKLLGSGGGGFLLAFAPLNAEFPAIKKSFRIF
ncbi:mevalonate kinase [Mangrovibacterium sp.]|uniref:mevalonate kinase family protein n=1 Tax=Mangrovibacterium sp. TaxID=1961364 RepID=UPI0035619B98